MLATRLGLGLGTSFHDVHVNARIFTLAFCQFCIGPGPSVVSFPRDSLYTGRRPAARPLGSQNSPLLRQARALTAVSSGVHLHPLMGLTQESWAYAHQQTSVLTWCNVPGLIERAGLRGKGRAQGRSKTIRGEALTTFAQGIILKEDCEELAKKHSAPKWHSRT
ncbi:hypothetical protein AOLI_G00124460 [Acnodon oligacanthus]